MKSRSACVGFSWISHGTTVYAEKATGTANFDDYYDNEHERPTYPNGTVARLTCDKGYAPYRSTNGGDVYDKYALYICDNGGWVREGEGDDLTTLSIHDSCKKSGWQLAEPPKQTEDEGELSGALLFYASKGRASQLPLMDRFRRKNGISHPARRRIHEVLKFGQKYLHVK